MTDKARQAIAYLRTIAEEWDDDGLPMSASYMSDAADTLEGELRRCRAETLREAFRKAAEYLELWHGGDSAKAMFRLANEAEREEIENA